MDVPQIQPGQTASTGEPYINALIAYALERRLNDQLAEIIKPQGGLTSRFSKGTRESQLRGQISRLSMGCSRIKTQALAVVRKECQESQDFKGLTTQLVQCQRDITALQRGDSKAVFKALEGILGDGAEAFVNSVLEEDRKAKLEQAQKTRTEIVQRLEQAVEQALRDRLSQGPCEGEHSVIQRLRDAQEKLKSVQGTLQSHQDQVASLKEQIQSLRSMHEGFSITPPRRGQAAVALAHEDDSSALVRTCNTYAVGCIPDAKIQRVAGQAGVTLNGAMAFDNGRLELVSVEEPTDEKTAQPDSAPDEGAPAAAAE